MGNLNVCPIEVNTSGGCWNCTTWPAKYVWELEENLDNLKVAVEELKERRDDVMTRVNNAEESQQMKRLKQVEGWLSRVEAMETEANELIVESTRELEKKCLSGCCPKNFISSYTLGKQVARAKDNVATLKCKGVFEEVAYRLPSAPVDERPSELTVGLEPMFDEVWTYIEDQQARIIGLYGMGGIGKTTLLNEINNKLFNTPIGFDVVIWVSVSGNRDLKKDQDDIGKKIGLHNEEWGNKRQEDKSIDIFGGLKKKKFMLLLDDIWERFDLSKVGVPIPNTQNKSKIVFTTRFEDVCCHMEADTKIKVKFLAPEKAWDLFQKTVGEATLNLNPELLELAKSVAKECNDLPLALITIGRAMACKTTPQEWLHAGQVLKKFAAEFSAATNVEDGSEKTKSSGLTSPRIPNSYEKQRVKEGQVLCYIEQLGGEIPIKVWVLTTYDCLC